MSKQTDEMTGCQQLVRAFQIFGQYLDTKWPTCTSHDTLHVLVDPANVTDEHRTELEALGFLADDEEETFYSFRFGSA